MLNPLYNNPIVPPVPILANIVSAEDCCGEACIGENGVEAFIQLIDTPNSYAGQAGRQLVVNNSENGITFIPSSSSGWRPAVRVSRTDSRWTPNDYTYTDNSLAGAVFFVYYNGVKILTPENEGFALLDDGGFTFDPNKFQFYTGEFLYLIF